MPFSFAQKQAAVNADLAGGRKPAADYIQKFGSVDKMFDFRQQIGSPALRTLVANYYPDKLHGLSTDLNTAQLQFLGGLTAPTLVALRDFKFDWVKAIIKVLRDTAPVATAITPLPGGAVGAPAATAGVPARVDQTAQHMNLVNTVVTERNAAGQATRNLIFNALGVCVAEVNFANHGGTAVSGHLHAYPVWAMPCTGHHASGTPDIPMVDYPALWRALPGGVAPMRALGT